MNCNDCPHTIECEFDIRRLKPEGRRKFVACLRLPHTVFINDSNATTMPKIIHYVDTLMWIDNNLTYDWTAIPLDLNIENDDAEYEFRFENYQDAVLFKLTWS